jgi:hypothetical protein
MVALAVEDKDHGTIEMSELLQQVLIGYEGPSAHSALERCLPLPQVVLWCHCASLLSKKNSKHAKCHCGCNINELFDIKQREVAEWETREREDYNV